MKDISKVKFGFTHSGKFHTDDVLSTVLLKKLNPNIKFERVEEYVADDSKEEIIAFDIGMGEFDHHQENRELNKYGIPYSAFGKLWREFGREYLKQYGFSKIDIAFEKFNKMYVSKIDEGDNTGYRNVQYFYENDLITRFNPSWFELKNNKNIANEQFNKAVEFATLLFENWIRKLFEQVELNDLEENIWKNAVENNDNGIIILEEKIPWQVFIKKDKNFDVKLIITKNDRGGYCVTSKDSNIIQVKDSKYLTFVHPSKFMGVASSLEDAIQAAKLTLDNVCIA